MKKLEPTEKEKEQELYEITMAKEYPLLYKDMHGDEMKTCMAWGLCISDGWRPVLNKLSAKLENEITEIKSKLDSDDDTCCYNCGEIQKFHSGVGSNTDKAACTVFESPHPRAAQVKEKFGCYDEKTRVLTNNGWKYFQDITYNDIIATLNSDGEIEYQPPDDIISYKYSGDMYRLITRGVDLLVTPNHNLYISKGTYYDGRFSPPKKVEFPFELTTYNKYYGKNKRFKKTAIWNGERVNEFILPYEENKWSNNFGIICKTWPSKNIEMNKWLIFLGWYISEGCSKANKGEVCIAANNTDGGLERIEVFSAIENIGYDPKETMVERSGMVFKIYEKRLAKWLGKNCGYLAHNKKVPMFIKSLHSDQIKIFLDSLFKGDGCKQPTSHIYTTVSKQLADDVCELLIKIGFSFRAWKRPPRSNNNIINGKKIIGKKDVYEINWLKNSDYHNTSNKGMAASSVEEITDYNGTVYCVSVPNRIILVERGGKAVWCGNSLRFYMTSTNAKIREFITEAEEKCSKTCEVCGKKAKLRVGGWMKTLCDTCNDNRYKK